MNDLNQSFEENSKSNVKEITSNKSLKQINFWKNRIYFDTKLVFSWFILYIILALINNYFLLIIGSQVDFVLQLSDIVTVSTLIFALYIEKMIKDSFEEIIINNKTIFKSESQFQNYLNYIFNKFESKKEKYLPVIFYFIWLILAMILVFNVCLNPYGGYNITRFLNNTYGGYYLPSSLYWLNLLKAILELIYWLIWFLIVGSGLIIMITTFTCINKLGSNEFPLNVNYPELKTGAFERIGKFIISLSIPSILLSTLFSVAGLVIILIFGDFAAGYGFLLAGLALTIIFTFLLYKNTTNIHKAITKFKDDLKYDLILNIQNLTKKEKKDTQNNLESYQRYETIKNIHDFYDRIDEINDWPFNPKSLRKFTITFITSILPFFLSLFGFL